MEKSPQSNLINNNPLLKEKMHSAYENIKICTVKSVNILEGTMNVWLSGNDQRPSDPIYINFASAGHLNSLRQMPSVGDYVLIGETKSTYFHLGSVNTAYNQTLGVVSDRGNALLLDEGEFAVNYRASFISVRKSGIDIVPDPKDFELILRNSLKQTKELAAQYTRRTKYKRSRIDYGTLVRDNDTATDDSVFEPLISGVAINFDEYHIVLNQPTSADGSLIPAVTPEYEEHIGPLLVGKDKITKQSTNSSIPEALIYSEVFSHTPNQVAGALLTRQATITTEIGESGAYNKKFKFDATQDISIEVDATNKSGVLLRISQGTNQVVTLAFQDVVQNALQPLSITHEFGQGLSNQIWSDSTKLEIVNTLAQGSTNTVLMDANGVNFIDKNGNKYEGTTTGVKVTALTNGSYIDIQSSLVDINGKFTVNKLP